MNDHHRLTIGLLKLFDLFLVMVAFILTTINRVNAEHRVPLGDFLSMRAKVSNLAILLFAIVVCHTIFSLCGLYRSRRLSGRKHEALDVLRATTAFLAFFLALSYVFHIRMVTMDFLAEFWVLSTCLLVVTHFALRQVADRVRIRGRDLRYMLIVGTNPRAIEFARRISASRERGYRLLGFVDDQWSGLDALRAAGYEVVSDCAGLDEYLRRNVVDEVAIYLPLRSYYKHSSHMAALCQQHGITMRINSDIFRAQNHPLEARGVRGRSIHGHIHLFERALAAHIEAALRYRRGRFCPGRSGAGLRLAAIAIKLSSPGPIFFQQERIGLNKRRFKIFKFRTMVPNAEQMMPALETAKRSRRSRLQNQERSAHHAGRQAAAPEQHRRTAAAAECSHRRHEPGGAAAAAGARLRRLQRGLAATPLQHQAGHHLSVAGGRPQRTFVRAMDAA